MGLSIAALAIGVVGSVTIAPYLLLVGVLLVLACRLSRGTATPRNAPHHDRHQSSGTSDVIGGPGAARRHQPFVVPIGGSFSIVERLTQGNSMGVGPIVPCVIDRTTSTKPAGSTISFVLPSSSAVHQRHPAWSSCSRGSHPAVDGSNRSSATEEGVHRVQRLTTERPLASAGGNRLAQLRGTYDHTRLFSELGAAASARASPGSTPPPGVIQSGGLGS